MLVLPHSPQLELATNRRSGVSIVTPLPQGHGDCVVTLLAFAGEAVGHRGEVLDPFQDPFGEAEADGQLEVVPGRAHRDRERPRLLARSVHPDLHGLFGGNLVGLVKHTITIDRAHAERGRRTPGCARNHAAHVTPVSGQCVAKVPRFVPMYSKRRSGWVRLPTNHFRILRW